MKLLCLGHSQIAQRRVLPALEGVDGITAVDVASRRGQPEPGSLTSKVRRCFDDYERALAESDAELVYVTTINSEHQVWVERALQHERHVLVDKPAFLSLKAAESLVELAARSGVSLAEATVYGSHPQVALCRRLFDAAGGCPTRIQTSFSMPPLGDTNFRYRREQGGGALLDLGPYAVSVGRIFFGSEPERLHAEVNSRRGEVETAFSVLIGYGKGRSLVGHFGWDTEYQNTLTLLGQDMAVSLERVYTTPPALENSIGVRHSNRESVELAPAGDSFGLFIGELVESINTGGANDYGAALLADARALSRLRDSLGESD